MISAYKGSKKKKRRECITARRCRRRGGCFSAVHLYCSGLNWTSRLWNKILLRLAPFVKHLGLCVDEPTRQIKAVLAFCLLGDGHSKPNEFFVFYSDIGFLSNQSNAESWRCLRLTDWGAAWTEPILQYHFRLSPNGSLKFQFLAGLSL